MKPSATLTLLFLFGLSACTQAHVNVPRADQNTSLPEVDSDPQLTQSLQFLQFLSSSSEGAAQHFPHSAIGDDVTVVVGRAYTSALGEECREAAAAGTGMQPKRFAICRDDHKGVWRLAPQIFSGGSQ